MASSTSYSRHPLPAPPQQDQSYTTYQPQPPAAQDYQYQPRNQPQQQTQLQQHPQHRQQQQWEQQREQQQRPPPVKVPDIKPQQQQQRINLTETSAEKEAKRLHSKADPRMALNEREPAMEAQTVSERPALRSIQHRDAFGNLIADPDRSNPTRNRWERPLDTIRGFEAAIDGGYNRKSFYRPETESVAGWNRRSSYYGGEQTRISPQRQNPISGPIRPDNGRPAQESFYGGRSNRTDGNTYDQRQSAMVGSSRDSYYEGFDGGPYSNGGPSTGTRNKYPRNQSEPQLSGRERNVYPIPNNHRSYETVASGSGTGSMGEPAGYQTDPTSSENSSIDRRSPPKRQQPMNDYGISFGQTPSYQAPGVGLGHGAVGNPPPLPRKEQGPLLRKPSKAPSSNGKSQERPDLGEKRKSWFMRRFSKNS